MVEFQSFRVEQEYREVKLGYNWLALISELCRRLLMIRPRRTLLCGPPTDPKPHSSQRFPEERQQALFDVLQGFSVQNHRKAKFTLLVSIERIDQVISHSLDLILAV